MDKYMIFSRRRHLINTDPQRRCYNGCHFSTALVWGDFEYLEINIPENKIDKRLAFWVELNDYAVSFRGESARCEFKKEKQTD